MIYHKLKQAKIIILWKFLPGKPYFKLNLITHAHIHTHTRTNTLMHTRTHTHTHIYTYIYKYISENYRYLRIINCVLFTKWYGATQCQILRVCEAQKNFASDDCTFRQQLLPRLKRKGKIHWRMSEEFSNGRIPIDTKHFLALL